MRSRSFCPLVTVYTLSRARSFISAAILDARARALQAQLSFQVCVLPTKLQSAAPANMGSRTALSPDYDAALPRLDLPPASINQRYPTSVPSWARPKSPSNSIRSRSSRGGSPTDDSKHLQEAPGPDDEEDVLALSAGCQPDEVYKLSLPAWRYWLRRALVKGVERESPFLASVQVSSVNASTQHVSLC